MNDKKNENPDSNVVVVYTVNDPVKAELIKNMLADHGVKAEIAGEHQAGFTGTFAIEIIVREQDAELAKGFIKDHNLL